MIDEVILNEAPKRFALNLEDDGRILSATYKQYAPSDAVLMDRLPTGETEKEKNIHNWRCQNGEYVYDPLPEPEPEPADPDDAPSKPTNEERIDELEEALELLLSGVTE